MADIADLDWSTDADGAPGENIPLMPIGEAADMGTAGDGRPLINPRLFDSLEYQRNPHPYFRLMRQHLSLIHI